ncbi:MAG: alpha/beta hydrolase [Legionellales bacterium]|nr:alpha/beta hydrolase [Legionellales bacterium]
MPYVTINDIKLHYYTIADIDDDKPTLIFLHGGAGMADHTIYIPFWSQLSAQANVIFVDQRGCGKSEKGDPQKWNLTQHGKDVFLFCDALGITNPIVAGVSWGGYVALSYAIQYPKHPMALILCNTEAKVSASARYDAFLRIANADAAVAVRNFDENWNPSTNTEYFKKCLPFYAKKAYTPEELSGCIQNPELWEKYMTTEHRAFDFTSKLHTITCSVLHLAGENDPVHPTSCAIETAKKIGENYQLKIIKDTGDPVYRDKPEETITIITEFLSKLLHHESMPQFS